MFISGSALRRAARRPHQGAAHRLGAGAERRAGIGVDRQLLDRVLDADAAIEGDVQLLRHQHGEAGVDALAHLGPGRL
ncbi:hypothetical protein, partial [Teichococcus aestuarii]|uniref:hypothetical protein n=1 Tax=Teichococcus aestuarii TaxID=568898 RepID=UPI00360FF66E